MNSPLGPLTFFEEGGNLLALEWGRAPACETSDLLEKAKKQLNDYFKGQLRNFDLPLKPKGTPFQQSVWALIRDIPYGGSCAYGDLALKLRSSPRAVGGACGRNPIPIIIPCHRVISAGGKMTGYSAGGGVKDGVFLLNHESNWRTDSAV